VTESSIGTPAGADTLGGLSAPPAPTLKLAGRRTPVAPEVEAGAVRWVVEAVAALEGWVDEVEARRVLELVAELDCPEPPPQPARTSAPTIANAPPRDLTIRAYGSINRAVMQLELRHRPARLVEYDALRRRLWIRGQRCHHGATGALVAMGACLGLVADQPAALGPSPGARAMIAIGVAGGVLMFHDRKDRSFWFERGRGTQP
jgi:hypothetical protein